MSIDEDVPDIWFQVPGLEPQNPEPSERFRTLRTPEPGIEEG
jgi:hypothetical protein